MQTFLVFALTNAVLAMLLAIGVYVVTCVWRNAHVAGMLWLLVLLKFVTPPLVDVPLPDFAMLDRSEPAPIVTEGDSSAPVLPPPPFEPYRGPVDNSWASDTTPSDIPASPATTAFDEPLPGGIETQDDRGVASAPPVERPVQRPAEHVADEQARAVDWPAVLLTAWLCGSVVCALVALVRIRRFRGVLAEARSADGRVLAICESAARQLGLKRLPRILIAEGNFTPLVWPVGRRSTVLLPRVLVGQLGDDELTTLVAHELAHLARRDHWVRWLELVCTVLYWWHPAVWWARRELSAAEDVCCDALVLARFPDRARCYAEALVKAIEHAAARQSMPVLASGLGERQSLRRRITMVVHETLPRRMSWLARLSICALGIAVLSVTLTAAPTDNESTADEPTDRADDVAATGEEIDASAADERTTKGDTAAATEPALAPDERNRPVKIKPGDQLQLHVLGTPDDPASKIWGDFRVEPSGTLPLGPSYGRVNVAGLTLEDAESVLRKFLGQILLEPQVQITWSFDESESTTNVPPAFESIGVLKAKLTRAKTAYDNTEKLYKQHVVSEATVVMAKAEYDIIREQLKQTERMLATRRLAVEWARDEYHRALALNKSTPGAISAAEIERLRHQLQAAIARVNELAENPESIDDDAAAGGANNAANDAEPELVYDGKTFSEWERLARTEVSPEAQRQVISALVTLGRAGNADQVASLLVELGTDQKSRQVGDELVKGLVSIDRLNVPVLVKLLENGPKDVRRAAASEVGRFGPAAQPALPALSQLLRSDDQNMRFTAIRAIGNIGVHSDTVVQALAAVVEDDKEGEITRSSDTSLRIDAAGAGLAIARGDEVAMFLPFSRHVVTFWLQNAKKLDEARPEKADEFFGDLLRIHHEMPILLWSMFQHGNDDDRALVRSVLSNPFSEYILNRRRATPKDGQHYKVLWRTVENLKQLRGEVNEATDAPS